MMKRPQTHRAGFTLVEMLIVMAVFGIIAIIGIPALQKMALRGKLEGAAKEATYVLQSARLEAVKRGVPVVALIDTDLGEVRAFADVNDAAGDPGSDLLFNPDNTLAPGARDYQLKSVARLGKDIAFAGPTANSEVTGFTGDPNGGPNFAVFEPDGSIRAVGAFRVSDGKGNFLETLVSPRATARVQLRKYNSAVSSDDGTNFHEKGNDSGGDALWIWTLTNP